MTRIVPNHTPTASPSDRANAHLCPHDRKRASTACAPAVRRFSFHLCGALPPRLACPSSVHHAPAVGQLPHTDS